MCIEINKEYVTNYKLKHPCVKCGEKEISKLTFHHRNPLTKKFVIASSLCNKTLTAIKSEIKKCDVLCVACHNEWHKINNDKLYKKIYVRKLLNSQKSYINKNGIKCVISNYRNNNSVKKVMKGINPMNFKLLYEMYKNNK